MTGLAGWTKVGPAGATGRGLGTTLAGAAGKMGTTRAAETGEWAGESGAEGKAQVWSLFLIFGKFSADFLTLNIRATVLQFFLQITNFGQPE